MLNDKSGKIKSLADDANDILNPLVTEKYISE